MPEVADAFRRFGTSYEEAHGAAMLPSHHRAIADIIACRTEVLGGQQGCCNDCGTLLHVFHSCRNRACPKCHGEQTRDWLEQRRAEMLPVPYFHVTVTVPEELRAALRRHQAAGYGALMKAPAEASIDLGRDPRWVGGTVGVLAVLHTWTQGLVFHPHVHCLVTGGRLSNDGTTWHPAGGSPPHAHNQLPAQQNRHNVAAQPYIRPPLPPQSAVLRARQLTSRLNRRPERPPPTVETSIGQSFYPSENPRSDAFVQPSLRAGKRRANSDSFNSDSLALSCKVASAGVRSSLL
jgi:hypothetical protein